MGAAVHRWEDADVEAAVGAADAVEGRRKIEVCGGLDVDAIA